MSNNDKIHPKTAARIERDKALAREGAKDAALARGDTELLGKEFVDDMRRIDGLPPLLDFSPDAMEDTVRSVMARHYTGNNMEQAIAGILKTLRERP